MSAREEFAYWCGRQGLTPNACETLRAGASRLHAIATREVNGYRPEDNRRGQEAKDERAKVNALRMMGESVRDTRFELRSGDGWLTTRLNHKTDDKGTVGQAVPK